MKFIITSPIGNLAIQTTETDIVGIEYTHKQATPIPSSKLASQIIQQLNEYFTQEREQFDLPLKFTGTAFQQKVWRALAKIPYGKTKTYGGLASQLKTSARAVGNACRQNPISIVIPCHRIVAQNTIGGYGGKTSGAKIDVKQWILQHENAAEVLSD